MLSIIICTYNREKYLYNCLKSIAENYFPAKDYEIVLINNNSTDNTEGECRRFQADFPAVPFRYFVETNQGLSFARNRGITEAQGDILVYVDDDATINAEYLKTIADFFVVQPTVMAVGGPIIPNYETAEPTWISHYTRTLITGYKYNGNAIKPFSAGDFPGGGNAAYRSIVFSKTGLFNTELGRKGNSLVGAEEKDIFDKMRQMNMPIFYLPKMILYHIIPPSKLKKDYFRRLTYSIGVSERLRTLAISKTKYLKRLVVEAVKWAGGIVLCIGFCLKMQPQKGWMLILFRWYVSKGVLGFKVD
ncbi:MAG: glycosyltransferase [Culturomica sp.]|jgi:glycosyltransferase involved in cell wall biosynthesis|nr:glycosyltransferase [Culturomica sp.]